MDVKIAEDWKKLLQSEFDKPYFGQLTEFVRNQYTAGRVYPPGNKIFSAFDSCPLDKLKVVILGQDPYHGYGQAHGLCFSVNDGVPFPPSLQNIFKEINQELGAPVPQSGCLNRWAHQGVFLLNATLTVREGEAGSHQGKGWERFTDEVIRIISDNKENVVFMLWGGYAKQKINLIDQSKHLILTSVHPSPLSANRGGWFGNGHFIKANEYLTSKGLEPINW